MYSAPNHVTFLFICFLKQAQPVDPDLTAKLLGRGVAVSPIVTVEPRRRKFHKAITLSMPAPKAHSQGMINQYSGNTPTLRLLCSITGKYYQLPIFFSNVSTLFVLLFRRVLKFDLFLFLFLNLTFDNNKNAEFKRESKTIHGNLIESTRNLLLKSIPVLGIDFIYFLLSSVPLYIVQFIMLMFISLIKFIFHYVSLYINFV